MRFFTWLTALLLFPLDRLKGKRVPCERPNSRFDERLAMFSRAAYRAGFPEYEDFYRNHPHLKKPDDRIRAKPPLLSGKSRAWDPKKMPRAAQYFEEIESISPSAGLVESLAEELSQSGNPDTVIRSMTRRLGAVAAGVAQLDPSFVYSHKGRFPEDYGKAVELKHPRVIVFLVEMDFRRMQKAPWADTILESAHQYYRAAVIAKTLEAVLKKAGYQAKAHFDAHYDLILPPLAVEAGLGELGRNNILVADRYGSRVRIGAVSTDAPFTPDRPVRLGVDEFCRICRKCAENCPSKALEMGEKQTVGGVRKWPTDDLRCYRYWRSMGTDCGICMAVCPFSHKNNTLHTLVRLLIPLNPWMRQLAMWCDDLLYGRRWRIPKRETHTWKTRFRLWAREKI